jgi:hypothetical protein
MLWRSLCIQGAWNYQGMQHLGFLWASLPALRGLPAEQRRQAMTRATGFYNAHPYFGGYLLGAVARLEAEGQGEAASRLKKAALTPLGASGDRLFWAGLKPLSGLAGMLALLLLVAGPLGRGADPRWGWGLALTGLATMGYNLIHVYWRLRSLREGSRLGLGLAAALKELGNLPLTRHTAAVLAALAGLALPLAVGLGAGAEMPRTAWLVAAALLGWQLPSRGWALPALLAAAVAIHLS